MGKISDATALSDAIDNADLLVVVDVSDTSQASSGTSKKVTITNFMSNVNAGGNSLEEMIARAFWEA
jgi:secreted trypsin-like serine protease